MKDYIFYPLCALFVGAVIFYALSFSPDVEPVNFSDGYEVKAEQLQYLQVPDRLVCNLVDDIESGQTVAVLTSNLNKKTAPPSVGISTRLGEEFENYFIGKTLKMTVRARASDVNPSPGFEMGYFSIGANSSGWKAYKLTDTFENYSLRLKKAAPTSEARGDYAGIWPDVEGLGRGMIVESIKVEVVDAN